MKIAEIIEIKLMERDSAKRKIINFVQRSKPDAMIAASGLLVENLTKFCNF